MISVSGCGSRENSIPAASIGTSSFTNSGGMHAGEKREPNLHPEVRVRTSAGEFAIKLDAERCPITVDSFLAYVDAGQYNGTIFHQVYSDFIVLGGGFDSHLVERPAQTPIRNEAHNGLKNRKGTIAMARQADAIDSATCQFFINLADNPSLDYTGYDAEHYGYCAFGEVISGMDVIDRIGKGEVRNTSKFENVPVDPVIIETIRRVEEDDRTADRRDRNARYTATQ
jgi:cyclophilin family peptidyl-prolyl cis-trans isomerase